jgi:hypothetical protein
MKKSHMVRVDQSAYDLLVKAQEQLREMGIGSPTFSDAVRLNSVFQFRNPNALKLYPKVKK